VGAAATATGRRLRTGVAHDARLVAGTTTAARRRLRPEPQRLDPADTLTAPAVPGAAGDATTTILAVPAGNGSGDDPDATVAFPVVAGRTPGRSTSDTVELVTPSGGVAVLIAPDPIAADPADPAGRPATPSAPAAAGREAAAHDPSEGTAQGTRFDLDTAAPRPGQGDVRRRTARRRSEGVVVPLRVPWRTRLRATVGLLALVAFLGALAAVTVAAVLLGLLQALSSV
jgi:hypothetical protein